MRNGSRFAAAPADDAPQFGDPLARLALAASKFGEDRSFFVRQNLAHGRDEQDAPGQPTVAPNAAPKRCLSLRARRMVTKGVMVAY